MLFFPFLGLGQQRAGVEVAFVALFPPLAGGLGQAVLGSDGFTVGVDPFPEFRPAAD